MKGFGLWLLFAAIAFSQAAFCEESSPDKAVQPYPGLMSHPELSTLASLVKKAGLWNFFEGTGPFTVFAPSNSAFAKMDQKKLEDLQKPENQDALAGLIMHHIVLGKYMSQTLSTRAFRAGDNKELHVRLENGEIWVDNAKVVKADLVGPNGVGYIIDTVLVP